MNKSELIDAIASSAEGSTKKSIDVILSAALETIQDAVAGGDKVTLVGFGSFEPRERAERVGRNPQTGAELKIQPPECLPSQRGNCLKKKSPSSLEFQIRLRQENTRLSPH